MKREIKFRAWDGLKMIFRGLHDRNWYTEEVGGKLVKGTHPSDKRNLKIMQFTGLHDKNGKEIYDGDILTANEYPYKDEGEYNYHAVVEWIYSSWQTVLRCVNPKKSGISDGINEPMEFEAGETTDYEIIGNIYQHKNLIE